MMFLRIGRAGMAGMAGIKACRPMRKNSAEGGRGT
jgi:hypothetical protein